MNKPDRYRKGMPPAFVESQPKYIQDELTKIERVFDLSVDAHIKASEDLTKTKVDFETLLGTTQSAADSAASAIQAASDAIDAKAWALIYKGNAENSTVVAQGYALNAANSSADASAKAAAAIVSKEQAGSYATQSEAAAAAASTYKLSAEVSMNNAKDSAAAAVTQANNAASYVTQAENAASASTASKVQAQAARDAAQTSAVASAANRTDAVAAVTDAQAYAGAAQTSRLAAEAARDSAGTKATAANTSASTASGYADAAGASAGAANQAKLDAQSAYGLAAGKATEATNSATAANTSASNANTSANAAGSSATAANQSKLDAQAAYGAVQGAANNAANSATAANTSAANALASANAAGTSASASNQAKLDAQTALASANSAKDTAVSASSTAQGYATASARDFTTLTARLNGNGSGITIENATAANASSVAGLQARWGIKITGANRVAGVQLNSAADGTSSFDIEAHYFNIFKPGTNERVIYWDGTDFVVRGNIRATSITAGSITDLGSNAIPRPIVGNPTIVAQGNWPTSQGAYSGGGFTEFIDTGIDVDSSWTTASTSQYLATATIAGGTSQNGGLFGYTEAAVAIGDGLGTSAGNVRDNRIYIRFSFYPGGGGGSFGASTISWKLARL